MYENKRVSGKKQGVYKENFISQKKNKIPILQNRDYQKEKMALV